MSEFAFAGEFVWQPDPAVVERSNLTRFMRRVGAASLDDLVPRSLDDVVAFWDAVLADLDIQFYEPYSRVVDPAHWAGLWRVGPGLAEDSAPLAQLGRSLDEYAAVVGGTR